MNDLPANLQAFVKAMQQDDHAADYGFTALTKKGLFDPKLFEEIYAAGLLSPERNPAPVPAKTIGYIQIPYWSALDYLDGVATHANNTNDIGLGKLIAHVITTISAAQGAQEDNYHSNRRFVEITAKLPNEAIDETLIGNIQFWLKSKYDHGLTIAALSESLLPRLLDSGHPNLNAHALAVFRYVTEVRSKGSSEDGNKEPEFSVDSYWLKELFKVHTKSASKVLRVDFIQLLRARVREVYSYGTRLNASWLSRPAVEEHEQNQEWDDVDNLFVAALRDAVTTLLDSETKVDVLPQVSDMYLNGIEIERRIAIYVFDAKFQHTREVIEQVVDERMFSQGCLHETFWFLKNHFSEFSSQLRKRLVDQILALAPKDADPDSNAGAKVWLQRRFAYALMNHKSPELDVLLQQFKNAFDDMGDEGFQHPDFLMYMTSWVGPGPSPYTIEELIWFFSEGSLADKLNSFQPAKRSRFDSSKRALVDTFELAIKREPTKFINAKDVVINLHRPYQYAYFNAYKELWTNTASPVQLDWKNVWKTVFNLAKVILTPEFWNELISPDEDELTPNRDWISDVLVTLIREGTKNNDHAFDEELLPDAWWVLMNVLDNVPGSINEEPSDPMSYALNTLRGRALDALFNYSLRIMRLVDSKKENRERAWSALEPVFDQQLSLTSTGNYQFSTLAACYCTQLMYLNEAWFERHKADVLSPHNDSNFRCAVSGLAYAPANKQLHTLLKQLGTFERALNDQHIPEKSRDRIVERLVLSYLWEQENLDLSYFKGLMCEGRDRELDKAITFLRRIHKQELSVRQRELVLELWKETSHWALNLSKKPVSILSNLLTLICYVDELNRSNIELILALIPFAHSDRSSFFFVEELTRLVDSFPKEVAAISLTYLRASGPEYDYQGQWLKIAKHLAANGAREEAISIAEIMHKQEGFNELYRQIR